MAQALFIIRVAAYNAPAVPVYLGSQEEYFRRLSAAIATLSAGSVFFVGQVALTAKETADAGWLICDGSAVSRSGFPALFGAIGERYGAGDGVTTFNIPTQAQCVAPAVAPTPPQVVVGGSVVPTGTPATPGLTGGTNANVVTGGRPKPIVTDVP